MEKYLSFNKYDKPDKFLLKEIERLRKDFFEEINIQNLEVFLIKINERNLVHNKFRPLKNLYSKVIPIKKTPQYVKDFSRLLRLGTPEEFSELKHFSRKPKRRKVLVFERSELYEKIPTNCHGKALWTNSILKIHGIPARIRQGFYYMDFMKKYVIHEKPEFFFENKWYKIEVDNLEPNPGEFIGVEDLEKVDKEKISFDTFDSIGDVIEYTKKRDEEFLNNNPKPVYFRN
jgi:hypothetical protein